MIIREFDPDDEGQADRWYAALHASAAAGRVSPLIVGRNALVTSLRTNDTNPNLDRRALGAWHGDECLGTLLLDLPRHDNTDSAEIEVNVAPQHRGQGVGAALFREGEQLAASLGRRTLSSELNVPLGRELGEWAGGRFALGRGFKSMHLEYRLLLELPLELPEESGVDGYRMVSWTGITPQPWPEVFAELHTLMDVDVPSGELSREPVVYSAQRLIAGQARLVQQGYGLVFTLIVGPGGEPAGYTEMLVDSGGEHALQDDTFVLRRHRGLGLGLAAKLANLRNLGLHHPRARHLHTWTAEVNGPMRRINDRLGFRPVEAMHTMEVIR